MRSPTDVLRDEHVVILRALGLLELTAERLDDGLPLPDGWWEALIGWLRAFADSNHHAKEETLLFPAMVAAGVPSRAGPLAIMLEEHAQGRALVAAMAGEPALRAVNARKYVELLRAHIEKEDGFVFPLADSVLDEGAVRQLQRGFEAVERDMGADADLVLAREAIERLALALRS